MRPLQARLTQAHRGSEHHFTQACRARILSSSIRVCAPHGTTSAAVCPVRLGIIQAAITTAVATAIATPHLTDFSMRFVQEWSLAWALAFLTMLPVVVFVSPFIQRCVLALTLSTAGDGLN